jgi:pimeloyl-ACP methyl ester carboxylesterase
MPSPVGHALAGVAVAWTADLIPGDRAWRTAPPQASWYRRAGNGLTAVCVALAAAPDLDLLSRAHRTYTHSIGAVVLAGLLAAIVAAKYRRPVARIALMCAAAYATHLALDWASVDTLPPYGLQALWPFSDAWLISGWDLFRQTERHDFFSAASIRTNLLAVMQEVAILAPPLVPLWLVRVKALAGFPSEMSRRHHASK